MNVGDDRDRYPRADLGQTLSRLDVVAGDPNDVGAGSLEGVNLGRGASTSAVLVVHIDWTLTGAPPPTGTGPTMS